MEDTNSLQLVRICVYCVIPGGSLLQRIKRVSDVDINGSADQVAIRKAFDLSEHVQAQWTSSPRYYPSLQGLLSTLDRYQATIVLKTVGHLTKSADKR